MLICECREADDQADEDDDGQADEDDQFTQDRIVRLPVCSPECRAGGVRCPPAHTRGRE
jgi:hypothetical protein